MPAIRSMPVDIGTPSDDPLIVQPQVKAFNGLDRVAKLRKSGVDVTVSDGLMPEWDGIVATFADALFDQTEVLGARVWGEHRLSKLVVRRHGLPIGAAQAYLFQLPPFRRGPGIAYVKFGPLWRRKDAPIDIDNLRLTLEAMVAEYVVKRRLCLTIAPQADPIHDATVAAVLEECGFTRRRELPGGAHYLVDLSLSLDEQRQSLGQKWRYNLKKAEKNGLEIRRLDGDQAVSAFMGLHDRMRTRKGYEDVSWVGELPETYAAIPEAFRPAIVLAFADGTPTAGAVIGRIGDTATYFFGGTDERALKLRAGYALQWWIIDWLIRDGQTRWYDLDSDAGDPGLVQFKTGLIGKSGHTVTLAGEYDRCISPTSRAVGGLIQSVRSVSKGMRFRAN